MNALDRVCKEDSRWFRDFGRFYLVDLNSNSLRDSHIDLEEWARGEGVLKPFEAMAD